MFDPATGTVRVYVERETALEQQAKGTLVVDRRRSRPLWFDGRFLTARDLRREQEYLLTRQGDLAGALGSGVIQGLEVHLEEDGHLQITPGVGIAQGGEHVVLTDLLRLDPRDIAGAASLDRAFGLDTLPATPDRSRTGIYALLLRPVAFTANPAAGYPASIDADRGAEDEDIVEGTLITLVPLVEGIHQTPERERAWAAARIFRDGRFADLPPGALPLAVVGLDGNRARWIDPWLLRRETEDDAQLALGGAARAERVALLRHYRSLLADLPEGVVSASSHFRLLPPAGPVPATAVQADPASDGLVQLFFPPEVDVRLGLIPADELPALIEESLALPPFDLERGRAEQAADAAMILLPVPRAELRAAAHQLGDIETGLRGVGRERDLADRLRLLDRTRVRRLGRAGTLMGTDTGNSLTSLRDRWLERLAASDEVWYVRRRQLPRAVAVEPAAIAIDDDDQAGDTGLRKRLEEWRLSDRFSKAQDLLSDRGRAILGEALSGSALRQSWLLTATALDTVIDMRGDIGLSALKEELERIANRDPARELEERTVPADEPWLAEPLLQDGLLDRSLDLFARLDPMMEREMVDKLGSLLAGGSSAAKIAEFLDQVAEQFDVDRRGDAPPAELRRLTDRLGMDKELEQISSTLQPDGGRVLEKVLTDRAILGQPLRAAGLLVELAAERRLDERSVSTIGKRWLDGIGGSGFATLPPSWTRDPRRVTPLARSGMLADLDTALPKLDPGTRKEAIAELDDVLQEGEPEQVAKLITEIVKRSQERPPVDDPREPTPIDRPDRPTRPQPFDDNRPDPADLARLERQRKSLISASRRLGLDQQAERATADLTLAGIQALTAFIKEDRRSSNPLLLQGLYADLGRIGQRGLEKLLASYGRFPAAELLNFSKLLTPPRTTTAKRVELFSPLAEAGLVDQLGLTLAKLDAAREKKLANELQTVLQGRADVATLKKLIIRAGRG